MFGFFKTDPIAKLEKKRKSLLEQAFIESKNNRKRADELTAEAAEIEKQIEALYRDKKN